MAKDILRPSSPGNTEKAAALILSGKSKKTSKIRMGRQPAVPYGWAGNCTS
jgi:hypothetical protein